MSHRIRLFRADGRSLGDVPLAPLLRASLERLLGRNLTQGRLQLLVYPVADDAVLEGSPLLVNLCAQFSYARVSVREGDQVTYSHPHTVAELLGRPLQTWLRDTHPDQDVWGYYLMVDGIPPPPLAFGPLDGIRRQVRAKPAVEGGVAVAPYAEGERPGFRIKRVEEPPPPLASLDDFPHEAPAGDRSAFVKILLPAPLRDDLLRGRAFSPDLEEGGFLTGQVYSDRDMPGTYLVRVAAAVPAEHTGASLLEFTYTGDSFSAIKRVLRDERPGESLLGWYHTHLFAATDAMGLSSIDLELHFTTFRQPWQLAGLINLDGRRPRVLRFYVRRERLMVPCPQWTLR